MADMDSFEKTIVVNKVVGCLIFSVFGAMGFFYSLWKANYSSAAWCLVIEVGCTLLLVFYKHYMRNELHVKFSSRVFRILKYVALVLSVGAFVSFITYLVVGGVRKEEFDVRSHYAAAPAAFIASFWWLVMFFDCKKFESKLE